MHVNLMNLVLAVAIGPPMLAALWYFIHLHNNPSAIAIALLITFLAVWHQFGPRTRGGRWWGGKG